MGLPLVRSLLAALLVCGAVTAPPPARSAELPTFEIVAKDGRLFPERIEVPSGQRIKLAVRNEGAGPIEFENLELRVEKVLGPGASSFVVIHPLKPGSYRFIDEFHPATAALQLIAK